MHVRDFESEMDIHDADHLKEFMRKRYFVGGSNVNSFWMRHDSDYPALVILVRDEMWKADYLLENGGYASIGTITMSNPEEQTLFYFDGMEQDVVNGAIITLDEAIRIACEFLDSKERPKGIQWLKL